MKHIIATWTQLCGDARPIRVVPDGCRDLIARVEPNGACSLQLSALDTGAYLVSAPAGVRFTGVRFAPGAWARWEHEQGLNVGLDEIPQARRLLDAVRRRPEAAGALLSEAAEAWFAPRDPLVGGFIEALAAGASTDLRRVSARSLRRRIKAATGAAPGFWSGLCRARRAARSLNAEARSLTELALEAGYADQPHMTRELRRWFGATPGALRRGADYRESLLGFDAFGFKPPLGE